ncbi:EAL domain-containing protein [Shewanella benthica]|uniref:EAL domain-containing protein n=1 Tax=Shewanella benthica TaxID=43661 RepID=UPI0018793E20|nr:EAL domain-containing protein [Shewanella benthica]MBE7214868.1 EAL domain-containing protein [Shewanella benthica]MCL1061910.1 EAL domain-containing protein [Shewanella benthica]
MDLHVSKILIIDDLHNSRIALAKVLQPLTNIQLVQASSGSEALSKLINDKFALVLLDVNMPDMDGYEVAELISATQAHKHPPIIMLTTHDPSSADILKAYQAGAIDYLTKPIESTILLSKVKQFVKIDRLESKNHDLKSEREVILEATDQGVIKVDKKGDIQFSNSKACKILNTEPQYILGAAFNLWFQWQANEIRDQTLFQHLKDKVTKLGLYKHQVAQLINHKNENLLVELTCTSAMKHADSSMTILFQDFTARLEMERRLVHLASYDTLTQLMNRTYFHDRLTQAIKRSKRLNTSVVLLLLDLDRFKLINDTLGHDIGDALLQKISIRLKSMLRETDIAARLGGDEFAILLEDCKSSLDAEEIAKKIATLIAVPCIIGDEEISVETSIGISCCNNGNPDKATLLKWADIALYAAKSAGRNCYQIFVPSMSEQAQKQAFIQNQLRQIIERKQLEVHYQGQYSIEEGRFIGFEALVRWPLIDNQSRISPAQFIPIAEQSRLIYDLGQAVLIQACTLLQEWQECIHTRHLTLAVNLSAKQLNAHDFLDRLENILFRFKFPFSKLTFEITETAFLEHSQCVTRTVNTLKAMGFSLALDDFGTGYSSLNYLQNLPFDIIKIDQCFIQRLGACHKTWALVKAIITIADAFNMSIVAEGVESKKQLDSVIALGCDKIQGYYFSTPIPKEQIDSLISSTDPVSPLKLTVNRNTN